jgi:hypothetical protein
MPKARAAPGAHPALPSARPPRQVRILNGQLQALSQLEARVDELAGDVARVSGGGRAA